jgi:formate dehydrogenase assembly factor FdhD
MQNNAPIPIQLPVVRPPSMEKRPPFVEVALASYPHLHLRQNDWLAQEEPLEISLEYTKGEERIRKAVSITMRTPGEDLELAIGFLISEGLLRVSKSSIITSAQTKY